MDRAEFSTLSYVGSNPAWRAKIFALVGQLVESHALGACQCQFESDRGYHKQQMFEPKPDEVRRACGDVKSNTSVRMLVRVAPANICCASKINTIFNRGSYENVRGIYYRGVQS